MPVIRLGIVLWLIAGIVIALARFPGRFNGLPAQLEKQAFAYHVFRNRRAFGRRRLRVRIGVALDDKVRFTIRKPCRFDALARWLGITSQWRSGDPHFDETLYVECDDPIMLSAISSDSALRHAVLRLFSVNGGGVLTCHRGKLVVSDPHSSANAAWKDADENIALSSARYLLPILVQIRERLAAIRAPDWTKQRDPAASGGRIIVGTTLILSLLGIVGWIVVEVTLSPLQLEFSQIETLAVHVAVGTGAVLIVMLMTLMRRSTRTHLALAAIVLLGMPAGWYVARTILIEINQRADRAPAFIHEARITTLYTRRDRFYVVLDRTPETITLRPALRIPGAMYARLYRGACVRIDMHPGYLGDTWLSAISHVKCTGH